MSEDIPQVSNFSFHESVSQHLLSENYPVTGVIVKGDKRSRLVSVSHLVQNGTIMFPRKFADQLIEQMVFFGVEKHEDLVDAFTLLINNIVEDSYLRAIPEVWILK